MERKLQEVLHVNFEPDQEKEWGRLRRGWYLGGDEFRDKLMEQADGLLSGRQRVSFSHEGLQMHDECGGGKIIEGSFGSAADDVGDDSTKSSK